MQLDRLLLDVTGSQEGASRRSQAFALTDMLRERHGSDAITEKGVMKWFERGSIPGPWLMKIAALPSPPIDLSQYA